MGGARRGGALEDRVRGTLARLAVPPDAPLVVAVSGGLDSVVLLHILRFRAAAVERPVQAAHFDHAMRPRSAADAEWVRGLCRAWEVDLVEDRAGTVLRSEAEAREARYAFLHEAADARQGWIATAHHADDQAETLLFRAVRGSGLEGLAGIAPRRGRVVRPLLEVRRADLLAYAHRNRLRWREDPTNAERRFARNRIRAEVMPLLEAIRPGAGSALARLAEVARRDGEAWRWVLREAEREAVLERSATGFTLARDVLLGYHPSVRARLIRSLLRRHGSRPDQTGTRAALEFIRSSGSGRRLDLPGGIRLWREFDQVRIDAEPPESGHDVVARIETPDAGSAALEIGGRAVRVEWSTEGPGEPLRLDALEFPLLLRGWRPGDRIRLAYGSKRLKRLFAEARVPRGERARVPVLVDDAGRVVWVAGLTRAAAVEPVAGEPVLFIALRDAEQP